MSEVENTAVATEEVVVPAEFKDIVEKIETMSVLDLHKLVKVFEAKFGVSAAATAVVIGIISIPPPTPIFRADHPFIFIIQERENNTILFIGRVSDPTS